MPSPVFAHGKRTDHSQARTVLAQVRTAADQGHVLTGYVSRISPQGAFVRLDALTGFVHCSEVHERYKQRVRTDLHNVLRPGQQVNVRVLSVSDNGKRIALSIRQAFTS